MGLRGPCHGCQKPDQKLECCGGRKVMAKHLHRLWWGFKPTGGLVGVGIRGLQGEGAEPSLTTTATAGAGWCSRFSLVLTYFSGLAPLQEPVSAPRAQRDQERQRAGEINISALPLKKGRKSFLLKRG